MAHRSAHPPTDRLSQPPSRPRAAATAAALAVGLCAAPAHAQSSATEVAAPEITVIGTTPLPGLGQPRERIAAPVQTANDRALQRSGANDLSDFMNRSLGSVHVNEIQSNPFQADVSYRGFTASPLLGTPQGISVYLDGVRLNQPFGDVVSWDLTPRSALANIALIPGSNPLYGLNTLGGALSAQTKDGLSHPGGSVTLSLGSHRRRALEAEYGGANEHGLHWFGTANLFRDAGWRPDSSSDVRQLFGKLGWRDSKTDVALSVAHADNELWGNGLQEQRQIERDYASIYTRPDITRNRSSMLNLAGKHFLNDNLLFSGNTYWRSIVTSTFNADINQDSLDQAVYQPSADDRAALAAAGYSGFPTVGANAANTPFPFWRCIAQGLQNDEPGEKCNALINRTRTDQENWGLGGQLTFNGTLAGRSNQLTAGAAYDHAKVSFSQSSQLGYLNPDRTVTGIPAFADGVTGGVVDGEPLDTRVNLDSKVTTGSLFLTDTLSLGDHWHLTAAGRYNRTQVNNTDRINPGGGANSLDGHHRFSRFNPALGITYAPSKALTAYAGYNEGSRAPTAIELGCANPDQPCKLPNAMAGDPPLKQVVTRTVEVGARGSLPGNTRWNLGVFRAENTDDILFVADNQAGFGYFKNFGKTRRQGVEGGASTRVGAFNLGFNYTYLDATYRTAETVNGSSNSTNSAAQAGAPGVDGTTPVQPGHRIPLIPRHLLKVYADYAVSPSLNLGANLVAVGGAYARGNENNAHQPDGQYYLGPGKSGGYAVLNLNLNYRATDRVEVFGQINNVLDRKYYTAAQLGATGFDAAGNFIARPFPAAGGAFPLQHATFYAPGAPRTVWIGVRYRFDKPRGS